MDLKDRNIIVTGGSRGIGRAIARACVREGARVGVNYRVSEDAARSLADELGDRCVSIQFDVTDSNGIGEAAGRFTREFGGIDGWVNNAGISKPNLLALAELDAVKEVLEVNLLGPILCSRIAIQAMLRRKQGVVLNLSSVAAIRPRRGQSVYAAAKGGVEALTRALAVEYAGRGIRVNGIRPGYIETEMISADDAAVRSDVEKTALLGKLGSPEDVAELAVFLLSDRAKYITGSIFTVDGGFLQG